MLLIRLQLHGWIDRRYGLQHGHHQGLQLDDIKRIAKMLQSQRIEKGTSLYHPGDPPDDIFIIDEGEVELRDPQRAMEPFEVLGKGNAFGYMALLTGLGAALGSLMFVGAGGLALSFIEGVAAGTMLTMIAQTMVPDAYFKGGSVIGLSTLMGFLVALFFKSF